MAITHPEMAELAGAVLRRPATRKEQKSLAGCVLAQAEYTASYTQMKRKAASLKRKLAEQSMKLGTTTDEMLVMAKSAIDTLVEMVNPGE